MGAVFCGGMMVGLDTTTQVAALCWMVVGLAIYFLFARKHSNLEKSVR